MTDILHHWLSFLEGLNPQHIDLGLERISKVLQSLDLPPWKCQIITVAGTNGKGSTVATLAAIYQAAGYHVATYTSPHLCDFRERIRYQQEMIAEEDLVASLQKVHLAKGKIHLTYFEYTTLAALIYFATLPLDVLILEVGLGGRLDAVNCIAADLAIITTIDYDHMDKLGSTREEIAFEKAGIFRTNQLAVCGDSLPPGTLLAHAQKLQVALAINGRDYHIKRHSNSWDWESATATFAQLPYGHLLCTNLACAIQAIELLQAKLPVLEQTLVTCLPNIQVPGRLQLIHTMGKTYLLDVAHNPQGMRALVEFIQTTTATRIRCVLGMQADKDLTSCLQTLLPVINDWYLCSLPAPRGSTSQLLFDKLQTLDYTLDAKLFTNTVTAFEAARADLQDNELLVICGSFVTVGEIYNQLNEGSI